jgi:Asp-tRNA(Asn)/Glu-tRNA(Gln) amidotransferase A subunit family amidase
MSDAQPHYATLLDTGEAIRTRAVSPVELTEVLLARIDRLEPDLRAFATVTPELALVQAKAAEAATITLPGGFHDGLPLGFQLVGRHLDEARLVRAGVAYQRATDWHTRHPAR